jgi:cell division protease FtsH
MASHSDAETEHRRRRRSFGGWSVLALFFILWAVQSFVMRTQAPRNVSYDELGELVQAGKVGDVELRQSDLIARLRVEGAAKPELVQTGRLPGIDETPLVGELRKHGVHFRGIVENRASWSSVLLSWVLPLALMALVYGWGLRRIGKSAGPLSFGKSRAKIYDAASGPPITFADVAGVDEAVGELAEVVDFLKSPERYRSLGAHIPKGVLLVGPPGTGKTLLARAVAGEASVPFFNITGSEFVEMFVGVGAARVRDLFEQAKQRAPCLVFVDEIDAIGKSRGGLGAMATHDEREQTLNQLLAEMDGFDANAGVILMAATNRPEVLDAALLRAGRFDRQVLVDRPDVRGRQAILQVHARRARVAATVDLTLVAQRTPAMVGADLANVVNEAALAAARRRSTTVEKQDFEEAIDRLQLGLRKRGRIMNEDEKRRVAHHEAGHALVALTVPHADPVHRVTIIPRTIGALGATLQLPTEDRYLLTRAELRDRICVMMGGRAAEELSFGEVSTGAQNDLERATETARQMVCRFGMSVALGARTYGVAMESPMLPVGRAMEERNYSDDTAQAIDAEVRAIIEAERLRATRLLEGRRAALEAVADRLLTVETLERAELEQLARPARDAA